MTVRLVVTHPEPSATIRVTVYDEAAPLGVVELSPLMALQHAQALSEAALRALRWDERQ